MNLCPEELATDQATVVQTCTHALKALADRGREYETFCCVYATAALLLPEDIRGGYALLNAEPVADAVMGVSRFEHPPFYALRDNHGYLERMWPEYIGTKTQFLPELLVSNGTFYWARTEAFLSQGTFYCKRLKGFPVAPERSVDVDTADDYERLCKLASQSS